VVAEVPGPEALQLDREERILYFISNNPCAGQNPRGGIYSLKLDSPNAIAHPLKFEYPKDFHPHGLSFFRDQQKEYLFTNNHRDDGSHTVEIFNIIDGDILEHEITISGDDLTSPNDLVAVGPKQFYVTNDGRSHDRIIRSMDTFLGRKTGNVLFYDGHHFTEVVDNLHFPNGIAINRQSNELIVGETLSGMLKVYQILESGQLGNVDNFFLDTGIDNISIDEHGQLWVAIHPNLWALSKHMRNTQTHSPVQVYSITNRPYIKKLEYHDSGILLSGLSAAISVDGNLYLGAVCDNKLLKCTINN
jgi:arylesterase/paraoxonase